MQILVNNEFILKLENYLILKIKFEDAISYRLTLNWVLSLKLLKNIVDRSRPCFPSFYRLLFPHILRN